MSLQIHSVSGSRHLSLDVSESVFGQEFNETLVHQLVTKYLAAGRAGTKAQKNRSAVSGGGLKPFRQKGTGRARAGTTRSPIWRTGGVTFAAQPRSYEQKLNKKMYRSGLRCIMSELLRQDRLSIAEDIYPSLPRTKEFLSKIDGFSFKRLLVIVDRIDENLLLAARNLANVAVLTPSSLDPVSLVYADKIVATSSAIRQIQERLS
ncbi:MAG: 50S ribosomal protein L4 [Methylomonas sp.]|nr:50S ribosomal protein L4 [Methylomonas sp.]PPD36664.1 MAG: 50S ribosomal protein L4 [Methylomonas sp.]PPD52249.1 MAG: 50S ribosomal protein L4 [Methylotenera sp.]